MKTELHKPATVSARIVHIPIDGFELEAELQVPPEAKGLVIFAHGSGSSRHSPRNKFVAQKLLQDSLATLLVDLLSEEEDSYYQSRFDIALLTERLVIITDWATHYEATEHLNIGYFGASTGAAAAMLAAAGAEDVVKAIVSRGGRVDLADEAAASVRVPTMLIVGLQDHGVREANEEVFMKLKGKKDLAEIPNATHLFEEPGALERVAQLASAWFGEYLNP